MQGAQSEIKLGLLASQRAVTPGVRDYGQTLVIDHRRSLQQAGPLASARGIPLPDTPTKPALAELDKLSKLSGPAFDREFVAYMVLDHTRDLDEFKRQADSHDDPQVAALARDTVPVLQKHFDMARALEAPPKYRRLEPGRAAWQRTPVIGPASALS